MWLQEPRRHQILMQNRIYTKGCLLSVPQETAQTRHLARVKYITLTAFPWLLVIRLGGLNEDQTTSVWKTQGQQLTPTGCSKSALLPIGSRLLSLQFWVNTANTTSTYEMALRSEHIHDFTIASSDYFFMAHVLVTLLLLWRNTMRKATCRK